MSKDFRLAVAGLQLEIVYFSRGRGEKMTSRHLFLFGGSPPFVDFTGEKFANLSLNEKGKVAILFLEREGWKEYMPKYTANLEAHGVNDFIYIPLASIYDQSLLSQLASCTGVIIGGGDTALYRDFIVDTAIGNVIKEMYEKGVPLAGFSAGALISPKNCVISPIDNTKKKQLFLEGLGLLKDLVIAVHFTKWNEKDNLKSALKKTGVSIGYGIDDEGYLYFENERLIDKGSRNFYVFNGL